MTAGPWAVARELGCAGGGELENWLLFLMGLAAPSSPFGTQPVANKQLLGTCRVCITSRESWVWAGSSGSLQGVGEKE